MKVKIKKVYGIGINDATYPVCTEDPLGKKTTCPFYRKWQGMLERCYSERYKRKNPTYTDCKCCEEWLVFSNFKSWMEVRDWEGKELDKDILFANNKLYAPDTCVFVEHSVNSFLNDCGRARGNLPIGVSVQKKETRGGVNIAFVARVQNPLQKTCEYLGRYKTPEEAHRAWKVRKQVIAEVLADRQEDFRVANALRERYKECE